MSVKHMSDAGHPQRAATVPKTAPKPAGQEPRPVPRPTGAPGDDPEFVRAENEDDDGYDPYSDRRPTPEPLFERDPWA